jgi:intraflagellar transport protein 140
MTGLQNQALIRFWNLVSDETYVISLTAAGLDRNLCASSVAFNPLQRYLAVGTSDGSIAMW